MMHAAESSHTWSNADCLPRDRAKKSSAQIGVVLRRFLDRCAAVSCLDADTLVLDNLHPLFEAIDAYPPASVLVCRDAFLGHGSLQQQLVSHYRGQGADFQTLLGSLNGEAGYGLAVNDGVFAGSRRALLSIDQLLRTMPHAINWNDRFPNHGWRNQFLFNLTLARMNCGVEIDPINNLQVHVHDVSWYRQHGRVRGTLAWKACAYAPFLWLGAR